MANYSTTNWVTRSLQIGASGRIRVYFEYSCLGGMTMNIIKAPFIGSSQTIYNNGNMAALTYTSFTIDIDVNYADTITLQYRCNQSNSVALTQKFRLMINEQPGILSVIGNP